MSSWNLYKSLLESPALRSLYVWGPPGIGKTYGAYHYGLKPEQKLYAVTLTEDTPSAELRGHYMPTASGVFSWHDGALVRAMRDGTRCVLNEVCHASAEVRSLLYGALESYATARITLPSGETIVPAPGFQCILTDNVDPAQLDAPLRDRIDVALQIVEPNPEAFASIADPAFRDALQSLASIADPARRIGLRALDTLERLISGGISPDIAGPAVLGERWNALREAYLIRAKSQA